MYFKALVIAIIFVEVNVHKICELKKNQYICRS